MIFGMTLIINKYMKYRRVLTIAGNDSSGGAGIQADIKTMSACGCYAMSAITAIPIQNTVGVSAVYPLPTKAVVEQIESVISDIGVDAVKIGMLNSSEVMLAVKEVLAKFNVKNIVLDPVMVSTSGHRLMQDEAIETLKNELLGCARIITPNIPEAEILLGKTINKQSELPQYARELSMGGAISVMLKAGHLKDNQLVDILYNAETDEIIELKSMRIQTKNTHGTGCTLSSAIASFIAHGQGLNEAVGNAKNYINEAIIQGAKYEIGAGHGPVHHFWNFWK